MIFKNLLTNGEIILIASIAFCTAISKNDTASTKNYTISTENYTASMENDTDKMKNDTFLSISYQLSYYIKQLHYDAKIKFNYEKNDIISVCNITIHNDRQIKNIFIESVTFAISKIVLYGNLSEKIYIPRYSFINDLNMLIIDFTNTPKLLPPGKYNLIMVYMRYINDNKKHFFESLYSNKELDNMLKTTGIDVMTARQLFPTMCSTILCRDEANLNATFKISIKHHRNYTALSNMPTKTTENDKDTMWTHFDKSPIMSFNRLRVVITTFTNFSTTTANITFWGRENATNYFYLAECIAQHVLYFLKHENNIIKLPKLDYVAFWDSQHNISETWGLIIHREADIIYNEIKDTISHKIQVSYLITYQIVSLWYADALLWSKTGFITLLATYILYKIPPNDDIINLFIAETQRESFLYGISSHMKEMNGLSYLLNYTKSSNIWRMLYHMIPDDVFWIGVRTYVDQQYNHTNTVNTDDLWNIMQTVLHTYQDNSTVFIIKELISIWIAEKYYYSVLYVTRNFDTKWTVFSYLTPDDIEDRQYHPIFVTYTTKSIMNFQEIFNDKFFWLSTDKPEKRYEEFDKNDWIIVNLQQTGYYRVYYDSDNWLKLALYMNSTKYVDIHVLNRAQIIDDAFYFLIHKQLGYIMFWKISAFLSRDTNYVAWYPMFKIFEYLTLKVSIEDATDIREHMEKILSGVLQEIGYDEKPYENDLTQCLREEAVKWACIIGNRECRTIADTQMEKDLERSKNDTLVTQPIWRRWMYCNGLKTADKNRWHNIWHNWKSTSDDKYLEYLTCYEDPIIISTYLQMTTEREFLTRVQRNTTRAHIILLTIAKHVKHDIVCDSVLKNLDIYILSFTFNKQTVKIAILIVVISHQHDIKQLGKVLEFAKTNLKEMRLIDAVHQKIKKRKLEYGSQVRNYGLGLTLFT